MGKGLDKKVEDTVTKAVAAGDWVLLENLHLAENWLLELEQIIAKIDKETANNKFRLFLSSVFFNNCPHMILK